MKTETAFLVVDMNSNALGYLKYCAREGALKEIQIEADGVQLFKQERCEYTDGSGQGFTRYIPVSVTVKEPKKEILVCDEIKELQNRVEELENQISEWEITDAQRLKTIESQNGEIKHLLKIVESTNAVSPEELNSLRIVEKLFRPCNARRAELEVQVEDLMHKLSALNAHKSPEVKWEKSDGYFESGRIYFCENGVIAYADGFMAKLPAPPQPRTIDQEKDQS